MPKEEDILYITNPEEFNQKASFICENPYSEYLKFKTSFTDNFKKYGPDSFSPTVAVFSYLKNFVGVVTCREAKDKNDLFKAMSQMLFFPMSIGSNLFIVANDVNMTQPDVPEIKDALVVSYVTPDHCLVLTVPYSYNSDNDITWYEDKSFLRRIASKADDDTPIGDLVELFFVYSHTDTTGPFQHEEVLSYLNHAGYVFEIFNPDKIDDKYVVSVPFKQR
jgi:hypothetical protein